MKAKNSLGAVALVLAMLAGASSVFGAPRFSVGIGAPLAAAYSSGGELVADTVFPLSMAHIEVGYSFPLGAFSLSADARSICYLVGTSFGAGDTAMGGLADGVLLYVGIKTG